MCMLQEKADEQGAPGEQTPTVDQMSSPRAQGQPSECSDLSVVLEDLPSSPSGPSCLPGACVRAAPPCPLGSFGKSAPRAKAFFRRSAPNANAFEWDSQTFITVPTDAELLITTTPLGMGLLAQAQAEDARGPSPSSTLRARARDERGDPRPRDAVSVTGDLDKWIDSRFDDAPVYSASGSAAERRQTMGAPRGHGHCDSEQRGPEDESAWSVESFASIKMDVDDLPEEEIQTAALTAMISKVVREDEVVGPSSAAQALRSSKATQAPSKAPSSSSSSGSGSGSESYSIAASSRSAAKHRRAGLARPLVRAPGAQPPGLAALHRLRRWRRPSTWRPPGPASRTASGSTSRKWRTTSSATWRRSSMLSARMRLSHEML